jgi:hypothetical protein
MEPTTFVGLDVHKRTTAVAIAAAGRDGEVRFFGEIPSTPEALHRLVERLKGDLRQANYSSLREGKLEFRRRIEQFQYATLVFQLLLPVWRRWLRDAVLAGTLDLPGFAPPGRPADFALTANTIRLPPHLQGKKRPDRDQAGAKQAVDQQFARWVMLHVQSNPLPICTRPRVLVRGKRT